MRKLGKLCGRSDAAEIESQFPRKIHGPRRGVSVGHGSILIGQASACLVLIFTGTDKIKRRQLVLHDVQCKKSALLANHVHFPFGISSKTWQETHSTEEERASQMNMRKLGKTEIEISPLV